jgi:hypothetical protein
VRKRKSVDKPTHRTPGRVKVKVKVWATVGKHRPVQGQAKSKKENRYVIKVMSLNSKQGRAGDRSFGSREPKVVPSRAEP